MQPRPQQNLRPTPPRTRLLGALATLMLLVPSWTVAATGPHACDYLTVDEVSQVMGFTLLQPERKPANPLGQTICFFDAPEEQGMQFVQLSLVTSDAEQLQKAGFTATTFFRNNMQYLDKPTKVEGIGEEAYWGGHGMQLGAGLHVVFHDVSFTILAKAKNDAASLGKSSALADVIVGKIK